MKRVTIQGNPCEVKHFNRRVSSIRLIGDKNNNSYFLYISPARDYEVDRTRVELHEIIGEGQFGDVHKGIYHVPPHQISLSNLASMEASKGQLPIAVKTCKVEGHDTMAEKFLEEACKF